MLQQSQYEQAIPEVNMCHNVLKLHDLMSLTIQITVNL